MYTTVNTKTLCGGETDDDACENFLPGTAAPAHTGILFDHADL